MFSDNMPKDWTPPQSYCKICDRPVSMVSRRGVCANCLQDEVDRKDLVISRLEREIHHFVK